MEDPGNLVFTGLVPALTFVGFSVAFYYIYNLIIYTKLRLYNLAVVALAARKNSDVDEKKADEWCSELFLTNLYRSLHEKQLELFSIGAFIWVISYTPDFFPQYQLPQALAQSPLGIDPFIGIRGIAIGVWVLSLFFIVFIIVELNGEEFRILRRLSNKSKKEILLYLKDGNVLPVTPDDMMSNLDESEIFAETSDSETQNGE